LSETNLEANRNNPAMASWAAMPERIGHKDTRRSGATSRNAKRRGVAGTVIVHALERERARISRELHAGAGQPLAGIKLNLELLSGCSADLPPRGREALVRLQALAEQALQQIRAVSHNLHPPEWQELTTSDALRNLVRSGGLENHFEVKLDIRELHPEPSHSTKIAIYRCAQESIANIVRHSGATSFALSLFMNGTSIELHIEDNGHGFPRRAKTGTGIGIRAIREHADALGGTSNVSSGVNGTQVTVRLPLLEE
jgi:signal transduction histidine kinase